MLLCSAAKSQVESDRVSVGRGLGMGMVPVPCALSSILPVHPPSSGVLLGQAVGGPFPISPSPFSFPSAPHWCQPLPLLFAGRTRAVPTNTAELPGVRGDKTPLPRGPPNGVPIPLPREAVPDPGRAAGWALPAAGTSRGAVSSPGRSGSRPRGGNAPQLPEQRRGPGTLPTAQPGPVSRRGGGGNRASRDGPGRHRGRGAAPAPAAGESGPLGTLGTLGTRAR